MAEIDYDLICANVRRPAKAGENYKRTPADVEKMLRGLITSRKPHALILLECSEYHVMLLALGAALGYDVLFWADKGRGDNVIMVRKDVAHDKGAVIEHGPDAWWIASGGGKSWGRGHVTVQLPGLRLGGTHTPPSVNWVKGVETGPANRIRTFDLMMQSLREYGATITGPALWFGDWNEPPTSLGEDSPNDVAHDLGWQIFPGASIDFSMGRDVQVKTHVIPIGTEGNTSDHPLLALSVKVQVPDPTPVPVPPAPKPTPEAPVPVKIAPLNVPFIGARWHGSAQMPKAVTMHGTVSPCRCGNARAVAGMFARETKKTSAHYTVDPCETIQSVGDHTIAYHCGYNRGSIAFELSDPQAGPGSRWSDADHKKMLDRAARDVAQTCLAYDIEIVHPTIAALKARGPHGIYGHNDSRLAFGGTTHSDPGPDFDWDAFIKAVKRHAADLLDITPDRQEPTMNHIESFQQALDTMILAGNKAVAELKAAGPDRKIAWSQIKPMQGALVILRGIKAVAPKS